MKYHGVYEITENEKVLLEEFRQNLESDDYYDRYWTGKKINILGKNISPGYFEINGWFGWVRCTFNYSMFKLDGNRLSVYCEGARNSIVEIVPQFLHEKLPVEVIYYESYNTNVSPFETHVDLFAYFPGTKTFNDIYERVKNLYVVHGESWFSLYLNGEEMKAKIKKDENEYNLDIIIKEVLYSFIVKQNGYEKFRAYVGQNQDKEPESFDFYYRKDKLLPWLNKEV